MLKRFFKNKWVKPISYLFLFFIIAFASFYASIYFGFWGEVPTKKELSDLKQSQATQILDKDEKLIGKFYVFDRQSVTYNDLPKPLIDALVATEDVRFYEHDGVDNQSLLRVFFKTILLSDESSGGGSTITLQLAKNLFGRKDYGSLGILVNKIRESIVAQRMEDIYSKKDILTMYFNTVPFSDNTYGIESASLKFFNKHTKELSLPEAATLVGSLKANHSYNPRLFPERSQLRRDVVLQQMVKYGYLSEKEGSDAMQSKIELDYQYYAPNQGVAPYFRENIKKKVEKLLKEKDFLKPDGSKYNIYRDGLKIYTTLDLTMQKYAEEAMQKHMAKLQQTYEDAYGKRAPWLTDKKILESNLKKLKRYQQLQARGLSEAQIKDSLTVKKEVELFEWKKNEVVQASTIDSLQHYLKFLNSGMVALDPENGAVRAYIGGIDYRYFKYDHVSQSKRQVGSTFKPFVYTAAIENGMEPCTYFPVKEVTYTDMDDWTPKNAGGLNDPDLNYSLEKALSNSVNTIAVKVMNEVGIEKVIDLAHKMGIESEIEEVPSIALGTENLGLLELAKAYTSFVNKSKPTTPLFITKIEDKNGNLIFEKEAEEEEPEQVYSDYTRQVMLEFMKATINEGTATRIRNTYGLTNDIAGKTGTTQDNKDGWFVGITPKLVTVTWVGNDDQRIGFSSTGIGQGANSALPIFGEFMQVLNRDEDFNSITQAKFETPDDEVLKDLNCELSKEDGFFKKLFGGEDDKKEFKKEKKKKGGIFSFLKGKKDED
ncbi:PBP1A family penicillin-binding protein [Mesonia sp.]|uniref:penicillin-binding protein 1A n=1 Tax=Mesonia sp. TaxID=1960830 RepID=UPI001766D928|nr:PBP1A family penicillin-binding protein [Mesonia sp.]HIB38268.1 PBP1A family penicillin-binding protein [Mesonia sp.]HIO25977.1 PBP1A family penicillin-binding protein [Flavobacteriaceae bacterium]